MCAGLRVVSVLPESVLVAAKQLKQPEALVRARAASALRALVDGAGAVGSSVHGEALKAAVKAASDRCCSGPCVCVFVCCPCSLFMRCVVCFTCSLLVEIANSKFATER